MDSLAKDSLGNRKSSNPLIIKSKIDFTKPPKGTNVCRELISALRDVNANRTLLVSNVEPTEYTGLDLWIKIRQMSMGLITARLIQLDQPVLLMCTQSLIDVISILASLCAGATIIMTSITTYEKASDSCYSTKPKLIILKTKAELDIAMKIREDIDGMDATKTKILILRREEFEKSADVKISFDEMDNIVFGDFLFEDRPASDADDRYLTNFWFDDDKIDPKQNHCLFTLTSGSTGKPKIRPWTHRELLNDIWGRLSAGQNQFRSCGEGDRIWPFNKNSIIGANVSLDRAITMPFILTSFVMGSKYVLIKMSECEQFWLDVERYGITIIFPSTLILYKLLTKWIELENEMISKARPVIDISSLKYVLYFGVKSNNFESLIKQMHEKFRIDFIQAYGLTEVGFVSISTPETAIENPDLVGYLFPGVEAKVVDLNTGKLLGPRETGELLVKSKSMFKAHIKRAQKNGNTIECEQEGLKLELDMNAREKCFDSDNFYKTGDCVYYDEKERLYINCRIDELIRSDDELINPLDFELTLDKHPLVLKSKIVMINSSGSSNVLAFVITNSAEMMKSKCIEYNQYRSKCATWIQLINEKNLEKLEKIICDYANVSIGKFEKLNGRIKILEDFPRIHSFSKIDLSKLRAMAQEIYHTLC